MARQAPRPPERAYSPTKLRLAAGGSTAGVAIALTSGSNPSCTGASVTFTATPTNGGTTPSYQWKVNGVNAGTNSATFTTSTLTTGQIVTCVMTSNLVGVLGNPATSNAITMTINSAVAPAVSIALTTGTNPSCAGASKTFTATPTNGGTTPAYQWKISGVNAGTNSATFTTSALTAGQIVTCVMTSNLACASPTTATSAGITASFSAAVTPSVAIAITAGSNPTTAGSSVTFTATPTNGGTTPSYQWKVNGVNAGTNSATFTTTTLTNGAIVTCVMTSNAACASPATATSNAITMTVTGTITYCAASTTTITYEYISNVTIGTINNTTTNSSYTNYAAQSTGIVIGVAKAISVSIGNAYTTDRVFIWVDWNNNGIFTDAGEAVYASAAGVGPFATTITAPAGTSIGAHRMRIRLTDSGSGPNLTPCGASTYGEVEDYTLTVAAAKTGDNQQADLIPAGTGSNSVELSVFPNPNNGAFTIKASQSGTYYLMNEMGQLMQAVKLDADNNYNVSIGNLAPGVYFLSGQTSEGITKQKIVVTH